MPKALRNSGIPSVGVIPWGAHLCHFYRNRDELLEVLVPYLKAGLEANELCVWVVSRPLSKKIAVEVLRSAVPDLGSCLKDGRIEIVTYAASLVKGGRFDPNSAVAAWAEKVRLAGERGFDGLRLAVMFGWVTQEMWPCVAEYERALAQEVGEERMVWICSYPAARVGPSDSIDLILCHDSSLVKTKLGWRQIVRPGAESAEAALRETEGRYNRLVEGLPDVVYTVSREGVLTFLNPAFEKVTGWSRSEWIGKPFAGLCHPDSLPLASQTFEAALRGETTGPYELRILSKSGEYVVGEFTSAPLIEKGAIVGEFGVARDITARKKAEAELLASERRYREMLENVQLIGVMLDLEGNVTFCNDYLLTATGWTREEVLGRNWFDTFVPHERMTKQEYMKSLSRGKVPRHFESEIITRQGERRLISWNSNVLRNAGGAIIGTAAIGEDVTMRRRLETQLSASEARYRAMVESQVQAVCRWLPDTTLLYVNDAYCKLFGRKREELIGQKWLSLLPDHARDEAARFNEKLTARPRIMTYEQELVSADGREIWVHWTDCPILDDRGRVVEFQSVGIDVTERKAGEEALRRSEEQLRAIFEAVEDCIYIKDQSCRCILVNPAAARLAGVPASEMIGKTYEEFHGNEAVPEVRESDLRVLAGETVEIELTLPIRGRTVTLHTIKTPLRDRAGQVVGICAVARDVSERRGTEQAVQRLAKLLSLVIENANLFVAVVDNDSRVVLWNRAAEKITGYTGEEVLGYAQVWDHLLPDQDYRESVRGRVRAALESGSALENLEATIRTKNGQSRTISWYASRLQDEDGERIGVLAIGRDVTEEKQAEQDMRSLSEFLQNVMATIPSSLLVLDPELNVVMVNKSYLERQGAEASEIVGKNIVDVFPASLLAQGALLERMRSVAAKGGTDEILGLRHESSAHPPRCLNIRICGIGSTGAAGEKAGLLLVIDDITKQMEMEEQVAAAAKMESIGRLAAGIAHDFNNILTAILGYAELASMTLPRYSPVASHLGEIRKQGERAAALIRQLLAYARHQVLEPRNLDLNQALRDMEGFLRRVIGEHIQLEIVPTPGLWAVRVDPTQFQQVVMNLAANARDAMPAGGRLTIRTQNVQFDEAFCSSNPWAQPGAYVAVSLADTGVGISQETFRHLFEPFFTTKGVGKGTGLGLSVVYGIVKQHGGLIDVTSEPGRGTTFHLYFKAVSAPADAPSLSPLGEPGRGGGETVLVAEDEEAVRELLVEILRSQGYTVIATGDGEEALREFELHRGEIALVILDVVMPKIGGRQVYETLRRREPGLKFLFISGYDADGVHESFLANEGLRFIGKPFNLSDVSRRVMELLGEE